MMIRVFVLSTAALLLLLTSPTFAARGPLLDCPECATAPVRFVPKSGWWYNPHEPGTGLNIEMQNGLLLGSYYGYDADGAAQWFIFNGRLQPAADKAGIIELTAPLQRFEGGACSGCEYQSPTMADDSTSITLRFEQRNYGSYSVDDGEHMAIVPLLAGVDAPRAFAEVVDWRFPDLEGFWVFVYDFPELLGWGKRSRIFKLSENFIGQDLGGFTNRLIIPMYEYGPLPEILGTAVIRCEVQYGVGVRLPPACILSIFDLFPGQTQPAVLEFPISLGNFGASRLQSFHSATGIHLEGFRLDFN